MMRRRIVPRDVGIVQAEQTTERRDFSAHVDHTADVPSMVLTIRSDRQPQYWVGHRANLDARKKGRLIVRILLPSRGAKTE
jgi:hypothetical protein